MHVFVCEDLVRQRSKVAIDSAGTQNRVVRFAAHATCPAVYANHAHIPLGSDQLHDCQGSSHCPEHPRTCSYSCSPLGTAD